MIYFCSFILVSMLLYFFLFLKHLLCFYEWKWNISFVIFTYKRAYMYYAIEMLWFTIRLMYTQSIKVPWHQRKFKGEKFIGFIMAAFQTSLSFDTINAFEIWSNCLFMFCVVCKVIHFILIKSGWNPFDVFPPFWIKFFADEWKCIKCFGLLC